MLNAELSSPLQARDRTLLCIDIPDPLVAALQVSGYTTETGRLNKQLDAGFQMARSGVGIVLLDVTTGGERTIERIGRLRSALHSAGNRARIMCFSTAHRNSLFTLALEKCGARYVRISDVSMLIDAVELQLAEREDLERSLLSFRITHRFSQGNCAPGEEIRMIEWVFRGKYFQLPLALSARFVFNCLAENQPHALDAFQIASILHGGWFYRDHAKNSGIRQFAKVRVPTVKVLVQRIRRAIAFVLMRQCVTSDPYEVLQSFPAEGSTRTLYWLNASISWWHRLD